MHNIQQQQTSSKIKRVLHVGNEVEQYLVNDKRLDYHYMGPLESRPRGVTHLTFSLQNMSSCKTWSEQFDVIFVKHTFEHMHCPWHSAPGLLAMLKPHGRLVFVSKFCSDYRPNGGVDSMRFTHTGCRSLFEFEDTMECIQTAYRWNGVTAPTGRDEDKNFEGKSIEDVDVIYVATKNAT